MAPSRLVANKAAPDAIFQGEGGALNNYNRKTFPFKKKSNMF